MGLAWGIGVVLLGIGCFGDGVGVDEDPLVLKSPHIKAFRKQKKKTTKESIN